MVRYFSSQKCFQTMKSKHPVGCKAQLAWKCLFTLTFSSADFDFDT